MKRQLDTTDSQAEVRNAPPHPESFTPNSQLKSGGLLALLPTAHVPHGEFGDSEAGSDSLLRQSLPGSSQVEIVEEGAAAGAVDAVQLEQQVLELLKLHMQTPENRIDPSDLVATSQEIAAYIPQPLPFYLYGQDAPIPPFPLPVWPMMPDMTLIDRIIQQNMPHILALDTLMQTPLMGTPQKMPDVSDLPKSQRSVGRSNRGGRRGGSAAGSGGRRPSAADGANPHVCGSCGRSFLSIARLEDHLIEHQTHWTCTTCHLDFENYTQYKKHIATHPGVKHHVCDVCDPYVPVSQLKVHMRIHTGEKPFICQICGTGFSQSGHLKKHIRIHTGEKPYRCDICNHAFSSSSNLTAHKRTHSKEKPYACPICMRLYSVSGALTRHLRTHSPSEFQERGMEAPPPTDDD